MSDLPDLNEQILVSHTGLIHRVVMHCNNPGSVPDIEQVLQQAEANDWKQLVTAIRDIMSGKRDESVLLGLDDEDRVIADSILKGLQDPATLPPLQTDIESGMAAPGIAGLIHASRNGNAQALHIIGNIAQQMLSAGGDMGILAGRLRPLVEGERDTDKLTEKMTDKGQKLMMDIIEELLKLEAN
ncbi:MAG TPA: hypothetical protein VM011_12690 [Gammaproteobacteria bacterium]|nr:hypothetical protein [Gammaproteobacteria bacterium]